MTTNHRRPAAVAGRFYPDDKKALLEMLATYHPAGVARERATAIIAPHAGYIYSGKFAGDIYGRTEIPDSVVVLCPNHTGMGRRISVWAKGSWETPLGDVPIDAERATQFMAKLGLEEDHEAHRYEHAIEVHLPFLLYANPKVRIVPICLGPLSEADCLKVGRVLAELKPPLIVASTDMSHYISAEKAKRLDLLAIQKMEALDPQGLYETVTENDISMCGFIPTTVTLEAARTLGARKAQLISYGNSGERTQDFKSVVAYASLSVA